MPFGIKEIPVPEVTKVNSYESAEQLLEFEKELYSDSSKNSRKRKVNLEVSDSSKLSDDMNIGKETLSANDTIETSVINKKKKLVNNTSTKENDEVDRVENKVVNTTDKKFIRLKVSKSIPISSSEKTIKKLNKIPSSCTIKSENIKTDCSSSKDSMNCNWNVDIVTSQSSTHDLVSSKNNVLENEIFSPKKKVMKKKSQGSSSTPKSSTSWLTPVLTRLEEQSKVTCISYYMKSLVKF